MRAHCGGLDVTERQLTYDIERLKRHFPAVPVKAMLLDVDEDEDA